MSVESEILRIQHNIANTYAAVSEKGGEVPLQPTSANLAAAVSSIPAASDIEAGSGLSKNGNVLNVDLPTEEITRAEYEALTEAERQADVLRIVDEPEWSPTTISVQEYDTEDGWHVRKYSDGYVEIVCSVTLSSWSLWFGNLYASDVYAPSLPLKIDKIYNMFIGCERVSGSGVFIPNSITMSSPITVSALSSTQSGTCRAYVTIQGKWK